MPIPLFLLVYKVLEKILKLVQISGTNSVQWFLVQDKVVVTLIEAERTPKQITCIKNFSSFIERGVYLRNVEVRSQYFFFKLGSRRRIQPIQKAKVFFAKQTPFTNRNFDIIMSRNKKDGKYNMSEDFLYQELVKVQKLTANLAILFE